MANQNTILTALGLDVSQFEEGSARGTRATKALLGAIASVDTELRKIPIVGDIYSATFGKIAEGFAETRLQAREFSRIMSTDVRGSLSDTLNQIDEINDALGKMKTGSFSRTISDLFSNFGKMASGGSKGSGLTGFLERESSGVSTILQRIKDNAHQGLRAILPESAQRALGGAKSVYNTSFVSSGDKRAADIADLEKRKNENIRNSISLLEQEAKARSTIYAGSELENEQARLEIRYRHEIAEAEREAYQKGGPEAAKWSEEINGLLTVRKVKAKQVYDAEKEAAQERYNERVVELQTSAKIADLQAHSNEREIASAEEKLALEKQRIAEARGVKEEILAAQAGVAIARAHTEQTQHQYDLSVEQLGIETKLQAAQVSGQTRMAKQLEIEAHFRQRISEELRRGNVEIAKQLATQQKLSQLEEAIRQYELGGRGRAQERASERHHRRITRTVQSRLNERERDQHIADGGVGGLRTGGIRGASGLAPVMRNQPTPRPQPKHVDPQQIQQFMQDVVTILKGG